MRETRGMIGSAKKLMDYTDKELRDEIIRRNKEKLSSIRHKRDSKYIYQECVITGRLKNRLGSRMNVYELLTDKDYGYHRYGYNGYVVAAGLGFKEGNLPHIGDRVVMRRRKYKYGCDDENGEWKICDIIS